MLISNKVVTLTKTVQSVLENWRDVHIIMDNLKHDRNLTNNNKIGYIMRVQKNFFVI